MASERFWRKAEQAFTSDGTDRGVIVVADVAGFKVKAEVYIQSSTLGPIPLEIKNIPDETHIEVGPKGPDMASRYDLSAFLVSDGATIYQNRQKRPSIGPGEMDRATYEEEPTVARRVVIVDEIGDIITEDNPFPVHIPDVTINAQLDVALDHRADHPKLGDLPDSVRIGDGVEELKVNPDGSINVVAQLDGGTIVSSHFNDVNAVPSATPTIVVQFTVPPIVDMQLSRVAFGGDNVATYEVLRNGVVIDRKRTWFNGNLSDSFDFAAGGRGLPLTNGDVIALRVTHSRPNAGAFEGRIQLLTV